MSRRLTISLLLWLNLGVLACGDERPLPAEADQNASLGLSEALIANARAHIEEAALRRDNRQRGWECGYRSAWRRALRDARVDRPRRWRSEAISGALSTGLVFFALGLVGVFLLAYFIPHLGRRAPPRSPPARDAKGWLAFLREATRAALGEIGGALQVDYFDRRAAEARVGAIHTCLEIERLLTATTQSAEALAAHTSPERGALIEALSRWLDDLRALRAHLQDDRLFSARLDPAKLRPQLAGDRRAARDLRLELARAELRAGEGEAPTEALWRGWEQLARARDALPIDEGAEGRRQALEPWVRPAGWLGLAALALAVPMSAAWTAAGAFPLFFALLLSLAGLAAVLTARVYLFQAGRIPLLPGLADRLARGLTWLALLTTALLIASSMASPESGLDLGDPPPVTPPSASELRPPPPPPIVVPAQLPK